MNLLNKKGFTLIELLAVIVVLAIILTIAIPAVTGSLNESKKNTAMIQAQKAAKAMKECYMSMSIGSTSVDEIKTECTNPNGKLKNFLDKSIIYRNEYSYIGNSPDNLYATVEFNGVIAGSNGTNNGAYDDNTDNFVIDSGILTDYEGKGDSVIIPETVKIINSSLFYSKGLTGVIIPEGVTTINSSAFKSNKITNIKLPSSLTLLNTSSFDKNQISGELDLSNISNLSLSGTRIFADNKITSIKFPTNLNSISVAAFLNNEVETLDLSYLTNLTSIGSGAFQGNKITSINFSNSLASIGASSFRNNELSGVLDLSYLTNLTSIGGNAFSGIDGDERDKNNITCVKLPPQLSWSSVSFAFKSGVTECE